MTQHAKAAKPDNPNKIGVIPFLSFTANGASMAIQMVLLGFLQIYCTNALGLNAAIVGTILLSSKILDAIVDLFFGYIIDRTNTKLGRGRPYDLCVLGTWLTTWMLFSVPQSLTMVVKCIWVFVAYTLCQTIFRSLLQAAGNAYLVRAFNNDIKYIKINSWGGIITTFTVVAFNVIFPMFYSRILSDAPGWSRLVGAIAIPMAIIGMMRFIFVPEKYNVDVSHEHVTFKDIIRLFKVNHNIWPVSFLNFIMTLSMGMGVGSYYFLYIVKDLAISGTISLFGMVAMFSMIAYPFILKKWTIKQLISYSLLLSIPAGLINLFAGANLGLISLGGIISGFVTLPASYLLNNLLIECSDYNEYQGLPRMEGTIGSISNFMNNLGSAFGSFLIGIMLHLSGFDGMAETQPESAIYMIRFCYALVPTIFALIAFFILRTYSIDNIKSEMTAAIKQRRAERLAASEGSDTTVAKGVN